MNKSLALGATTVSAAVAISLLGAAPSRAQDAQDKDAGGLQEIVVTARYREENLQQTPIAITAVTADDIEQRGFTSAAEVALTVPNASFRPAQAAFGNTMTAFIRGIGQYDFQPEFEPGVGIYFDDVLHPVTMGSMVDLLDLERVEVLRGPQGTLFGRGSIGGAIRYVSRKPEGSDTGSISVTYGDFDRIDVRASYDFGITENFFARVTGVAKRRDGYQDVIDFACAFPDQAGTLPRRIFNRESGCKIGTQGGEDVTGARLSLRLLANDRLEFSLAGDFLNDDSEARADTLITVARDPATGNLPGAFQSWSDAMLATFGVPFDERFLTGDPFKSYATYSDPATGIAFVPKTAVRQKGVSAKADWEINDLVRMELILAYREFDSAFATDADQSPLGVQTVDGRQRFESKTAELRFSGRALDRVDWTAGYFHYNGDFVSAQQVSIGAFQPPGGTFLVNGLTHTEPENNSVFLHTVWTVTDKLNLTAGLRYSEDRKDEQFDNTIVQSTGLAKNSRVDWKAGADYRFTDWFMGYVSAATGYRPQAFNTRPFQVTQFVPVEGEEATSYELGFKADFLDRRLRMNLAGFFIDYNQRILPIGGTECLANNQGQYTNLVPPGTEGAVQDSLGQFCVDPNGPDAPPGATVSRTFYDNIPAEVKGVELELAFRPVEALTLSGMFGYTDFEGDELDNPGLLGAGVTRVFTDQPAYVPERNWNVTVAYDFGVPNGGRLTPRLDYYGQSRICPTVRNNVNASVTNATLDQACADGFEILNARLEWGNSDGGWTAAVGVNNVTDEKYFLNKFDLTVFGQPTIEGQPGRPREWYVTFTRNF
jgi:iron complex outermembrane receptor protein